MGESNVKWEESKWGEGMEMGGGDQLTNVKWGDVIFSVGCARLFNPLRASGYVS